MQANWAWVLALASVVLIAGCRPSTRTREAKAAPSARVPKADPASKPKPKVQKPIPPPKKPSPVVKTEARRAGQVEMAEAKKRLKKARRLFGRGDYERAEVLLKEAITIFPFVPEANLLLGKIFLIRGAANRDLMMMDNARLMFEMARAMEPDNREISTLLELFRARRLD